MRLVVALGGNAIAGERGADPASQQEAVEGACDQIAELIRHGHEVVITHGNGPQVGNLLLKNDLARHVVPPVPLDWCVAQTQATLGFLIATALEARVPDRFVAAVVTRVLVAADDPAWQRPTKPIGRYVSEAEAAERIAAGEAWEERGEKGWRRMVPSPQPLEILDRATIEALIGDGRDRRRRGRRRDPDGARGRGAARRRGRARQGPHGRAAGPHRSNADVLLIATDVEAAAIGFGYRPPGVARLGRAGAAADAARRRRVRGRQHGPEGGGGAAASPTTGDGR